MSLAKSAAELLGTFWLVFCGCGSAVLAGRFKDVGIGLMGVALAFGLTVLTMVYTIGPISGAHLNPAVSVGLAVGRRFLARELLPCVIALCLTLIHLVTIPLTGTSVNPARSTGPALVAGGWPVLQLWLFWVAPLRGAVLAGAVYRGVFEEK